MSDLIPGYEAIDDLFYDKEGNATLGKLFNWLMTVEDRVSMSLPAYLKRAVVESKVFLTREAAVEECINDLLYCINTHYAGWVLSALAMNQYVNGSKIRNVLETVATEDYKPFQETKDLLKGIYDFQSETPPNIYSGATMGPIVPNDPNHDDDVELHGSSSATPIEFGKDFRLISGILIDVNFAVGKIRNGVSIPILVRLLPRIIDESVAGQFFASNFKLDMWMRWFKVTTGEIRFWKDFVFQMDMLDDYTKALKKDKHGDLEEMFSRQQNSLTSYVLKILGWRTERQNLASTIHIFTKPQFDQFCRKTHCNFNNQNDRLKYFRKTMSMMIAVIDSEYNTVDMYYAGVGQKASYQFSQLQNATKPNQYDLTSIMRAFSNTQPPRF